MSTAPPRKPPTLTKPAGKPAPVRTTKPAPAARVAKTFSVQPWTDAEEGEKIVIYAKSGSGKTTLASMAPNPVFLGLDDGGRKIVNPITGHPVNAILGVEDFQDVRDALRQNDLWPKGSTVVIDTVTKLEERLEPYIFEHFPLSNGGRATSMRKYGWDGPGHVLDCYRLLLSDLDQLVRKGVNVILLAQLAQITVANAEGADYLEDGPKLQHNKQYSVRTELCEWADHVFRIGYADFAVEKDAKDRVGKVQQTDATRAIYTGGAPHFIAKSRPINGHRVPAIVSFESPADDSLWQYVFGGAVAEGA